jgi:NAD(P)-dependent dehydrogenase (short-subunit alcohol dehydrogenase family)
MKIDLSGKVAVITGGSRGLGEAMAETLSAAGASIALVARSEEKLKAVRDKLNAAGGDAEYFMGDVTDEEQVARIGKEVIARFGAPQILINNAGTNARKQLVEATLEDFQGVVDSSLKSAFLISKVFVPGMKEQKWGRIINMTSILSHIGLPGRTPYCSAKFGLLGLTKALALELAGDGVTVNGISPGPFGTEMNHAVMNDPQANAQFLANLPVGRWGKVEEIGGLACYLCSDLAGFITGTDILIDGGWTAK